MFLLPCHKKYQFDKLEKPGDWFFIPCSFVLEQQKTRQGIISAKNRRKLSYKIKINKGEIVKGEPGLFVTRLT